MSGEDEAQVRAVVHECLRRISDRMRQVLWVTTASSTQILYVGPAYEAIWGRSCESLLANPMQWFDAIHPEDQGRVGAAFLSHPREFVDLMYRVIRPDGEIRWIRDRGGSIEGVGGEPLIAGIAEDITDLKNAEDSLARSEARLRQSEKLDAVGRLAGGIAHDFNNYLAAIGAYAELALGRGPAPAVAADLEQIRTAVERAADLTHKLLAFSRQRPVEPRVLDLNASVRDMHRMLERLLGADVKCEVALEPAALPVLMDAGQLEQVLLNLVANARDAMPKGGALRVSTGHALPGVAGAPDGAGPEGWAVLAVADTGTGVDPAVMGRLFEPFVTTKPEGKGTGLGLSIIYGIVRQAGGHITVESDPGRGTTVTVYLPRAVAAAVAGRTASAEAVRGGTERILIAEDNAPLRTAMAHSLEGLGYRVSVAADGEDALATARGLPEDLDLLVTDVVMPRLGGPELARALRDRWPDIRVVFVSGFSGTPVELARPSHEVFLDKPFELRVLASAVRKLLDARAGAGG